MKDIYEKVTTHIIFNGERLHVSPPSDEEQDKDVPLRCSVQQSTGVCTHAIEQRERKKRQFERKYNYLPFADDIIHVENS